MPFCFSFKFWIIPSLFCNSFKCTRIPTGNINFTSLKFFHVVFEIDISPNYIIPVTRGSSKGALESFWHNIHLPQSIWPVESETVAYYFCYHQYISYNSKGMNKFLHCINLNKVRNKRITRAV